MVVAVVSKGNGPTKSSAQEGQHGSGHSCNETSSQGQRCSGREEENFSDSFLELCFHRRKCSL